MGKTCINIKINKIAAANIWNMANNDGNNAIKLKRMHDVCVGCVVGHSHGMPEKTMRIEWRLINKLNIQ